MKDRILLKWMPVLFCLILSGCAAVLPAPSKPPPGAVPEVKRSEKGLPEAKARPRELASLHLTEQGETLLGRGKIDDAIGVLERAVSIYPSNGKNYYLLAEAWIGKGNLRQAREWNRLAEMYLAGDRTWQRRVYEQRERINIRNR